jgi:predicted RNase H-like nuclease (RuvC/YqgF family)
MSKPDDFDPFDPIAGAMRAMHQGNMLAAKDARIKQLEADVERMTDEIQVYKEGVTKSDNLFKSIGIHVKDEEWVADGITQLIARIKQLEERLEGMREAGDQLWYCVRHAKRVDPAELIEAIEDWQEARNHG